MCSYTNSSYDMRKNWTVKCSHLLGVAASCHASRKHRSFPLSFASLPLLELERARHTWITSKKAWNKIDISDFRMKYHQYHSDSHLGPSRLLPSTIFKHLLWISPFGVGLRFITQPHGVADLLLNSSIIHRWKWWSKWCGWIIVTFHTVDGRNPAPPGMYKTL